jgi:hypothetical protein
LYFITLIFLGFIKMYQSCIAYNPGCVLAMIIADSKLKAQEY